MDSEQRQGIAIEAGGSEYTVSLRAFFQILRRRLWAVMLVAVVVTGAVVGFSLTQPPTYQATAEILVGQQQTESTPGALQSDIAGLQQLAQTAVEAINSRRVAEEVVSGLNLQTSPEALLGGMSAQQVPETQFIQVSYTSTDPQQAQRVANALAEVSSDQISEISPDESVSASVWEEATTPEVPVAPDPVRNGVLGLLLGLMLGIGLALLLEYLDDSWRSPEEVEEVSGVPTFSVVLKFEELGGEKYGKKERKK